MTRTDMGPTEDTAAKPDLELLKGGSDAGEEPLPERISEEDHLRMMLQGVTIENATLRRELARREYEKQQETCARAQAAMEEMGREMEAKYRFKLGPDSLTEDRRIVRKPKQDAC